MPRCVKDDRNVTRRPPFSLSPTVYKPLISLLKTDDNNELLPASHLVKMMIMNSNGLKHNSRELHYFLVSKLDIHNSF